MKFLLLLLYPFLMLPCLCRQVVLVPAYLR